MSEKTLNVELTEQQLKDVAGGAMMSEPTNCPVCGTPLDAATATCPQCQGSAKAARAMGALETDNNSMKFG